MKTFFLLLASFALTVATLQAKPLSLREKRLSAKTKFKIEKTLVATNAVDKVLLDKTKLDNPRKIRVPSAKSPTVKADKVLEPAPNGKDRRNSHFREWP